VSCLDGSRVWPIELGVALNEERIDAGGNHPVAYADEP
jgi:hypothetical protein